METVNPLETARNLKPGESKLVGFNDYKKFRSFTVQLSEYNSVQGRQRNIFVHAASKKRLLQTYLVATTADEHDEELVNSNVKGEWRKLSPETWLNQ